MSSPLRAYFIRIELFFVACSLIGGTTFWLRYDQTAGLRMAFGTLAVSNIILAWVFRKAIWQWIRDELMKSPADHEPRT